jgi:tetratricopeptide (TPR) repeat protein
MPTMAEPERIRPRFGSARLTPRNLLLPVTLAIVFLLRWKLGMPIWGVALLLSLLLLYHAAAPLLVRRGGRELERELLRLFHQGRRSELLPAYRRRWLLRLLAPPDRLQRLLGLVHSELGDFSRASACFEAAARDVEPAERLGVLMGLAKARYRAGDYEGAEVVYRELLRRGQAMPEILGGLAHSLLLRERDLPEALDAARRGLEEAPPGPAAVALRLTLAEALLLRGRPRTARVELDAVELPAGDRWLETRQRWVQALLARSEGEEEEARELFAEVADLDERGGLGDLARKRVASLERLGAEAPIGS